MIERARHIEAFQGCLRRHPVVAILGAWQVGKATLARQLIERQPLPWEHTYPFAERVRAVALSRLDQNLEPLSRGREWLLGGIPIVWVESWHAYRRWLDKY